MLSRISICAWLLVIAARPAIAQTGSDASALRAQEREEIQSDLFSTLSGLPDGAAIRGTFERFLAGDSGVAQGLAALTLHSNEDVARYAALSAGWVGGPDSIQALRDRFTNDTRSLVKATALIALCRTSDTGTAALAVSALSSPDEVLQMAGIGALKLVGTKSESQALLNYLDAPARAWPRDAVFEALEKLGDLPGSTAVTTRLRTEASKKTNKWETRLAAAESLRRMGHDELAPVVLNRSDAGQTYERMLVVDGKLRQLVKESSLTIRSQSEIQALLAKVVVDPADWKQDLWNRPLRVKYLSPGKFAVLSDGRDGLSDTPDDISTAEAWAKYDARMFRDLF